MNAVRSLDQSNSVEKAYAFIKEGILTLQFKQRDRLGTQELAERLRISRTPIREALARLEQEGLVLRDAGWGYVVKGFSATEVLNLYRVREVLEVEAIHEAIQRLDQPLVELLSSLMEKAEAQLRGGRFSDFQSVNRQFHALVAQTTGNALLQQMLRTISDRIRILGALVLAQHVDRAYQIHEENKRILEALKTRDATAAELAVREHIRQARDNVLLYFGQQSR
jgi:DNA-binding GntR family transcriptional regulator